MKNVPKREIQITAEATGDLIGNKIDDKITCVSKSPMRPQRNGIQKMMVLIVK